MPPKYMVFAKSHVQDRDAAFSGNSNFEHCKFYGFKADESGKAQTRAVSMPLAPDAVHPAYFSRAEFYNSDEKAMIHIPDPLDSWAEIKDCGNFPCTGLKNAIVNFCTTRWYGEYKKGVSAEE